jgi:hypothetical protein
MPSNPHFQRVGFTVVAEKKCFPGDNHDPVSAIPEAQPFSIEDPVAVIVNAFTDWRMEDDDEGPAMNYGAGNPLANQDTFLLQAYELATTENNCLYDAHDVSTYSLPPANESYFIYAAAAPVVFKLFPPVASQQSVDRC